MAVTREIQFELDVNPYCHGSVIVNFGKTRVHVTASIADDVPRWLKGTNKGWVTAEYAMLPGSTHDRIKRERRGASGIEPSDGRAAGYYPRTIDQPIPVECKSFTGIKSERGARS